jgi:hypothetical protein
MDSDEPAIVSAYIPVPPFYHLYSQSLGPPQSRL